MSPQPRPWAFADPERRTFVALNSDGTGYHLVHPVAPDDQRVKDGKLTAGLLTCECPGGRYRGSCYQSKKAEEQLRAGGASAVATVPQTERWFDWTPGELQEGFGK